MKWNYRLTAGLLAFALLFPAVSARPALADQGLDLHGSRTVDKQNIIINETFTLNYCIQPVGKITQRDKIALSMVLDTSGSMKYFIATDSATKRITALQNSSKQVTAQFKTANFGDEIALASFATSGTKLMSLTTDYSAINKAIDALNPNGSTNMDEGMKMGYDQIRMSSGSKKMILVTDGAANYYIDEKGKQRSGTAGAEAAVKQDAVMLAAQKVPVYTIAIASEGSDVNVKLLQEVANLTGGQAFSVKNSTELDNAMQEITKMLKPTINHIVLTQPLPPGFQLIDGQADVTLANGVLTKTIPDIPSDYGTGYACAVPVRLKYTGEPASHTLSKATVNYNVDKTRTTLDITDPITLNFVKANGLQGTASLQNDTLDLSKPFDIHDALTVKYDISPIGTNIGKIKNAKLTHLLPEGVTATVTGATYSMVGDRQQLMFTLSDYTFNGTTATPVGETRTADLHFSYAGTFDLRPADPKDLVLSFTDETGTPRTVPLTHTLPSAVQVKVFLSDKWQNRYIGDEHAVVTREGPAGSEQFHVDLGSLPVKDMSFVDGTDQSKVNVLFKDATTATLDLTPSAPSVVIKDADGNLIPIGDAAYKKGPATIMASGSVPNLPADTVFANGSLFKSGYVDRYEYQVNGGGWSTMPSISGSGQNLSIQARAVTRAISGTSDEHVGAAAVRTVSLDSDPPTGPLYKGTFLFVEGQYAYTIQPKDPATMQPTWQDSLSGLVTDSQGNVIFDLVKNGVSEHRNSGNAADLKFTSNNTEIDSALGVNIRLTDKVGLTGETPINRPVDTTPPTFNPTDVQDAQGANLADRLNTTFEISATEDATEDDSFVGQINLNLHGVTVLSGKKSDGTLTYSNNNKTATLTFKLRDVIRIQNGNDSAYWGWQRFTVEAKNYSGKPVTEDVDFKVNPGPQFELKLEDPASGYDDQHWANQPVTIDVADLPLPVPAKENHPGVTLANREYVIGDVSTGNSFKPLRGTKLTVAKPGVSVVHIKLTDSDGVSTTQDITVYINYDQKRY